MPNFIEQRVSKGIQGFLALTSEPMWARWGSPREIFEDEVPRLKNTSMWDTSHTSRQHGAESQRPRVRELPASLLYNLIQVVISWLHSSTVLEQHMHVPLCCHGYTRVSHSDPVIGSDPQVSLDTPELWSSLSASYTWQLHLYPTLRRLALLNIWVPHLLHLGNNYCWALVWIFYIY